MELFLAWIIGLGVWVMADGVASIWAYHGKERWWRNQSFRVLRIIVGAGIVILGSMVLNGIYYN